MVELTFYRWRTRRNTIAAPTNGSTSDDFSEYAPPFARPRKMQAGGQAAQAPHPPTNKNRFSATGEPTSGCPGSISKSRRASAHEADQAMRELHRALVGDVAGAGVADGPLAGMSRGAEGKKESTDAYTLVPQLLPGQRDTLLHPSSQQAHRVGREPPPSALPAAFRQPRHSSHSAVLVRCSPSSEHVPLDSSSRAASFTGSHSSQHGSMAVRSRATWEGRVQAYALSRSVNTSMTGVGLTSAGGSSTTPSMSSPTRSSVGVDPLGFAHGRPSPSQFSQVPLSQLHQGVGARAHAKQTSQLQPRFEPPLIRSVSNNACPFSNPASPPFFLACPVDTALSPSTHKLGGELSVPRSCQSLPPAPPASASTPPRSDRTNSVPASSASRTISFWKGLRKQLVSKPAPSTVLSPSALPCATNSTGPSIVSTAPLPYTGSAGAIGSAEPLSVPAAGAARPLTYAAQTSAGTQNLRALGLSHGNPPSSGQVGPTVAQRASVTGLGDSEASSFPCHRPTTECWTQPGPEIRGSGARASISTSGQLLPRIRSGPYALNPPTDSSATALPQSLTQSRAPSPRKRMPKPLSVGTGAAHAGAYGARAAPRALSSAAKHYGADLIDLHRSHGPVAPLTTDALAKLAGGPASS